MIIIVNFLFLLLFVCLFVCLSASQQLVWARSWSVGCGIYHCEELEDLDWEDEENEEDRENEEEEEDETLLFLVCDYGPGSVYTSSIACWEFWNKIMIQRHNFFFIIIVTLLWRVDFGW